MQLPSFICVSVTFFRITLFVVFSLNGDTDSIEQADRWELLWFCTSVFSFWVLFFKDFKGTITWDVSRHVFVSVVCLLYLVHEVY